MNIIQPTDYNETYAFSGGWQNSVDIWQRRGEYVVNYAFAIPTEEAIKKIVSYGKIVEMGAGTGYWAKLIETAGGDIVAYDTFESHFKAHSKWFDIRRGSPVNLIAHADRALFLCWPPMTDMAEQCLKFWKGNDLIVIGEERGCTGSDEFEYLLVDQFEDPEYIELPQWYGIHDTMRIFKRKGI